MNNTYDTGIDTTYLGLLMAIMVISLFAYIFIVILWVPFRDELRFYKLEISRADDKHIEFWKKELKYFYIRSIPFIGKFIYRRLRKRKSR